jgi:hypothetical protein
MDVLAFDPCDQPLEAYDAYLAAELHKFAEAHEAEPFTRQLTPLEHAGSSLVTNERLTFSPTTFNDELAHYHESAEASDYGTLSSELLAELMRHDLGPPQRPAMPEESRSSSVIVPRLEYEHARRYSCSAPPRYEVSVAVVLALMGGGSWRFVMNDVVTTELS